MIKKYTRDTRKILKAWNWKASKVQARDSQGARESSRAYARDVIGATLSPKAQARNDCDAGKTPKAQTADTRYSYLDCLCDKAPAPAEVNGSTLYQLLMVGCMVLFVFTANGVGGHGVSFLAQSH
jgi:hypothetical protein